MPSHSKKKVKKGKNTSNRAHNIVRVDRIVAAALRNDDLSSLDIGSGVDHETETRGQMLQRHKAERVAMRKQIEFLREQRLKISKSLDGLQDRKHISRQIKQLEETLRTSHETQAAALEARLQAASGEQPFPIAAVAFNLPSKKSGPLRIMSSVHTPGPQFVKNTAASSSS